MKFYLTARFERKNEVAGFAEDLARLGHEVTSRWITVEIDPGTNLSDPIWPELAKQDVDDIRRADAMICLTETSGGGGARHAEFGLGLGLGKQIYIVGNVEHLFHTLPQLKVYPVWEALLRALEE